MGHREEDLARGNEGSAVTDADQQMLEKRGDKGRGETRGRGVAVEKRRSGEGGAGLMDG